MTLTERIHALIFNGITKASAETYRVDSLLTLSERERFTQAVVAELRAGNIEFRLGPLAQLAEAAEASAEEWPLPAAEIERAESLGLVVRAESPGAEVEQDREARP